MPIKEELKLLSKHVMDAFMQCGRKATYHAGEWLPDAASGFIGMRLIKDGAVSVFAIQNGEKVELCRSGKDEFLGVRSMFSPESQPVIAWRAEGEVACLEFEQDDILPLLQGVDGFELRHLLEKAARERDYDVLMTLHPLFRCLPRRERKKLLAAAHPIALLPDEALLRQNIENDALYLISRGCVEVSRDGEFLARRETGDVIGEISVFGASEMATADVISCGWCEVLVFPGTLVRDYCRAHAEFEQELMQLQADIRA